MTNFQLFEISNGNVLAFIQTDKNVKKKTIQLTHDIHSHLYRAFSSDVTGGAPVDAPFVRLDGLNNESRVVLVL